MPSLKRRHPQGEPDDDDEIVEVQQASSSMAQEAQSNKRARLSVANGNHPEPTPDRENAAAYRSEDDQDDSDNSDDYQDALPQTQYEIMRDAGFKHLENLELDDERATEQLSRRPHSLGDNVVAESGIIESITCYNFMCHERLHVELGPLINFIVGENGSGKSAVLTALTLCLGGKASDTNRGGSLKSFVKEGRDQGKLVVRVKNAGPDAYQPDIYGNSIIIERHFSKTGTSGFKIKTADDKLVSTKKQEIDEISEWFALQMGNPLTILSQDNARQFLNSATPAQKYKYFVSGVQLEQLDNDYRMSQDTLDKTLNLREDINEKVASVKKEMESALRLAEAAQKNQSLREKARHYRCQLVWWQVVEQEIALQQLNAAIDTRTARIADTEQECETMGKALLEAERKLQQVQSAREELNAEDGAIKDKVASLQSVFTAAKDELVDLHVEETDAHTRLKLIREAIRVLEKKIEQEERRLGESTGAARAEKDAQLDQAKAKVRDVTQKISDATDQLPDKQEKVRKAEDAFKRQQQLRETKQGDIVMAEKTLSDLQASTGSAYDGFDRETTNLVKAIAQHQGFENMPVGPIGAHVKLRNPEWSGILEKTFGESLNAFVVRSKADQSKLSDLMQKSGMKRQPPIFIAYGGHINTRSQEPAEEFDTILRVLEFDDDIFRTQLIINSQIEKVILVQDRAEAEKYMVDGGGPPRNVSACLCFHDGRGKRGQGLRLTNRNGNVGTAPIVPTRNRPRMQSDSVRQLAIQKEHLKHLEIEFKELNAEERLARQALQRSEMELESHGRDQKELEKDLRRARADAEEISTELDAFEGADGRLITLRTDLEAKQNEEEQLGSQYGNMKLAKNELNKKAEAAKQELEEARRESEAFSGRVQKAEDKIQTTESMRRIAVARKNAAYEQVDIERAECRRAEERRDRKAEEVADFTAQALAVVPDRVHIPEGETYVSIERKYQRIGDQLALREQRLGATDEQIFDRANEAKRRYETVLEETDNLDRTIDSLKGAITQRLSLWRQFQRQISARIRIQFNYLLSERGFRGKIDLRHKERKVVLHIEPDETKQKSAGRDTKTLSGGEKSFSSICMLLSVWEAIGSPIRCLDEFDVFMDNVNRAISTNMLVDTARRSVSRQYILITPNAIEGRARLDKDVKIIRLTDPRQRTLI
ncbi:RecF/RecN/SMC protein [Cordyceps fumosorosea ARSEF 2679]|uniref:RecF/RecN/SMC protein n=1 Tax=Cordyceps fumosorosea (strain ARSEF 2679) TaxID=1081104 RepID=A0A168EGP4_CORFA|nr:RecF/RecN/SMC protein [Cordyceps fumosorosea ARSEF 2679]OAA73785.1 RecF/RecN/SMC protein [Cordyceps fumosorosea ARSEF 2679]